MAKTARAEMIEAFRKFREAEGLEFDRAYVPRSFVDQRDLELLYWQAEDRAKALPKPKVTREKVIAAPIWATRAWTQKQLDKTLEFVGYWASKHLRPMIEAPLLERVKRLEETSLRDAGIYVRGRTYGVGDCVTADGSYWVCKMASPVDAPGRSSAWRFTASILMTMRSGTWLSS